MSIDPLLAGAPVPPEPVRLQEPSEQVHGSLVEHPSGSPADEQA